MSCRASGRRRRRSGCTCTSRSARRAATTAPSPRGPTATRSWRRTPRRAWPSCAAPPATRACPRPPACTWAGARRRACPPTCWPRSSGRWRRAPGAEVTVECNPEDASAERFARWRRAGVNRVSFGVQSMVPRVLESLGRRHGTTQVARALALAGEAGFASVNVDLILGAAAETDADLVRHPRRRARPRPPPGPRERLRPHGRAGDARSPGTRPAIPTTTSCAGRYALGGRGVVGAGYRWYEVSNWARPGHECRHNALYWAQGDYRGIGCTAHSHRGRRRWWNIRTPERYIEAVHAGRSTTAADEVLTDDQAAFEGLALALRTSVGVPATVGARRSRARRARRAAGRTGRCSRCAAGCSPTR